MADQLAHRGPILSPERLFYCKAQGLLCVQKPDQTWSIFIDMGAYGPEARFRVTARGYRATDLLPVTVQCSAGLLIIPAILAASSAGRIGRVGYVRIRSTSPSEILNVAQVFMIIHDAVAASLQNLDGWGGQDWSWRWVMDALTALRESPLLEVKDEDLTSIRSMFMSISE